MISSTASTTASYPLYTIRVVRNAQTGAYGVIDTQGSHYLDSYYAPPREEVIYASYLYASKGKEFERRAAILNIAGVPPADLSLVMRDPVLRFPATQCPLQLRFRPRWSPKSRRPIRSRRRLRTWERAMMEKKP